jgi:hypothetical protein
MRLGSLDGIIAAQVKNGEGETHMDSKETRAFAQQLMKEVWEQFNSEAVSRFFHRDVVGWHRRADSSWQQLGYDDVVNRL